MAQVRSSDSVAISTRWLGGGAVILVHLIFLLALLLTDKLSPHRSIAPPEKQLKPFFLDSAKDLAKRTERCSPT